MAAKKKRYAYIRTDFKGVDYHNPPALVAPGRGVQGLNMVPGGDGGVEKRTGYRLDEKQWSAGINGVHFLTSRDGRVKLIHSGTGFYIGDVNIYSGANNAKSRSLQIGDNLYILDGASFLKFDGEAITKVMDSPYVPLVYTGRSPEGGGRPKEPANILTTKRTEGFVSDGASTSYMLSSPNLADSDVTALIYRDDGSSYTAANGDGLAVNTTTGVVVFTTPPPKLRDNTADNVFITYNKGSYAGLPLEKCTVMGLFGRGGKPDTLFLSGNPDYPGREWYSGPGRPNFFGENNTDVSLDSGCRVMGYSAKGDKLFVHRRSGSGNMNILVRQGDMSEPDRPAYPVVNRLEGPGTLSKDCCVNMARDSLFLTEKGVYAVAEKEADGRHFSQLRSLFINPSLLANQGMENAVATAWKNFYTLAVGKDMYLLDTSRKAKETVGRQYECYHWQIPENIRLVYTEGDSLCFATENGRTGRFYTDRSAAESYSDNGLPIKAVWQTGGFDGSERAKTKSLHRIWLVCRRAGSTGFTVSRQVKGSMKQLFTADSGRAYFIWSALNWAKFTWSGDSTPKLISKHISIKNIDTTSFLLENNGLNQPFGISEIGVEYTKGGFF